MDCVEKINARIIEVLRKVSELYSKTYQFKRIQLD